MSKSVFEHAADLTAARQPFALTTVVRTQGSTPQVAGAKLIVTGVPDARPIGTLGGGCVEADAILAARDILAGGPTTLRQYQLTEELAWNTGLVCGGTMWILAEPGSGALQLEAGLADDVARATRGGQPLAFVTLLVRDGRDLGYAGRLVVRGSGERIGSLGRAELDHKAVDAALEQMRHGTTRLVSVDDRTDLLVDPVTAPPRLVVAGGGHVAKAIARQAHLLDFAVTILEDRPEFADPERFGGAEVIGGDVPTAIANYPYGWQTYLVIATRGHKLDADCVLAAAGTTVPYIGVLGSRRKTVLIADMLREHGVSPDRIQAIHAPVGLDLGGRTPAEIALAVMAEITQRRYSGTGVSLSQRA